MLRNTPQHARHSAHPQPSPPEFTQLVTEVMELALKAIGRQDPIAFIEETALHNAQDLQRLRRQLATQGHADLDTMEMLRCETLRVRIARDCAHHLIEAFGRLRRAKCVAGGCARKTTIPLQPCTPRAAH